MDINKELIEKVKNNSELNKMLIIKFTATWCGPCRRIKDICKHYEKIFNPVSIYYVEVDIDDNSELYSFLKSKRMINGVPSILAYYTNQKNEMWYIPNDSVSGGDVESVEKFFKRCISYSNKETYKKY